MRKVMLATVVGNILEFYDFLLFAFFVPLFSNLFFPYKDPNTAILMTYATFAVGFVMRPLGGLFIGHIGDKYGRKPALTISILMMAVPTTLIGLLPTYETIGGLAPILLIGCRLLQGFCTGGEFNGAGIFIYEHSKRGKAGYASGIITATCLGGSLIAQLVATLTTINGVPQWTWRLGFLFGGMIALIGLYIRLKVDESPEFKNLALRTQITKSSSFSEVIKTSKLKMLLVITGASIISVLAYTLVVYAGGLLRKVIKDPNVAKLAHCYALMFAAICYVVFGFLSDYLKKIENIMIASTVGTFFCSYYMFSLFNSGDFSAVIIALIFLSVLCALSCCSQHVIFARLFPVNQRYIGVSFSYNISMAFVGGTTPYINEWLSQNYSSSAPAFYLMLISAMSFVSLLKISQILSVDSAYVEMEVENERIRKSKVA